MKVKMYVGDIGTKQLVSIGLMIMFALAAMFFIGYQYAYSKAVSYANEQIEDKVTEFKMMYGIINKEDNQDFILGNIEFPDMEVEDEEGK